MHLNVRAELVFDFAAGSEAIVSVQAAHSQDQTVLSERLVLSPVTEIVQDEPDARGERRFRARLSITAGASRFRPWRANRTGSACRRTHCNI